MKHYYDNLSAFVPLKSTGESLTISILFLLNTLGCSKKPLFTNFPLEVDFVNECILLGGQFCTWVKKNCYNFKKQHFDTKKCMVETEAN